MTLEEILANKEFAIAQKKAQILKRDLSTVLIDEANKAYNSNVKEIEVLVYEADIKRKRNEFMFDQYLNGYVLNHSVGMQYIKLLFCYNSEDPQYSTDKANWDKYFPMVLNQDKAIEKGYFWAVTEAKKIEGSAVVKGSNSLTPVLSMEVIDEETIRVKCAISPSNIIDSHMDCHIAGLWKKTMNENNYDLLLQEHDMDFDKVIADSINDNLKVYTEIIEVKKLISAFKTPRNKEFEPSADTQNKDVSPASSKNLLYIH